MGGTATPLCWSCGYAIGQAHGRNCLQADWHKDPLRARVSREVALEHNETYPRIIAGSPPGWVRARVHVEALKQGLTLSKLVAQVLTEWAQQQHGGKT